MIPALQKGKLKIKHKEDNLTSSIFQLLMYLPNSILVDILQDIIGSELETKEIGHLENIEYWSKWNPKDTSNQNYVEPEILLSFQNIDIIIEAKRWDNGGQYERQWRNELIAYQNEYPDNKKEVVLWALGGINNLESQMLSIRKKEYKVIKTKWTMLLTVIKSQYLKFQNENTLQSVNGIEQIFQDLLYSFQLHGFFVGTWMEEAGFEPMEIQDNSLNYFTQQAEKYHSAKWFFSLNPVKFSPNSINLLQEWIIKT